VDGELAFAASDSAAAAWAPWQLGRLSCATHAPRLFHHCDHELKKGFLFAWANIDTDRLAAYNLCPSMLLAGDKSTSVRTGFYCRALDYLGLEESLQYMVPRTLQVSL
jgi:hypothetical protein